MKKLLPILIALFLWPAFATTVHAQDFASGKGTEADPYIITTIEHLQNVSKHVGKDSANLHFALGNDIDLSTVANWTPIGIYKNKPEDMSSVFCGTFDGRGHVIRNITIKPTSEAFRRNNLGLFTYLYANSVVKNVGIENGYIEATSSDRAGFIAGESGGIIENCYAIGTIKARLSTRLGGIVGYQWTMDYTRPTATIKNCFSVVDMIDESISTIIPNSDMGGICGYTDAGAILQCYSLCRIISDAYSNVGGIAGTATRSHVEQNFAYGYLQGKSFVGGILGYQFQSNYTKTNYAAVRLSKSSYTDQISPNTPYYKETFGGIVGGIFMSLEIVLENYFSTDVFEGKGIGISSSGLFYDGATGLTNEQMRKEDSYEGETWIFGSRWNIWENNSFPYLASMPAPAPVTSVVPTRAEGIFNPEEAPERIDIYFVSTTRLEKLGEADINKAAATWSIDFATPVAINEYIYAVAYREGKFASPAMAKVEYNYFGGGLGTAADPFRIQTPEHMRNLSYYMGEMAKGQYFIIENDIDFKNEPTWIPLRTAVSPAFFGNLNGKQHAVKNLTIDAAGLDTVGLFTAIGNTGIVAGLNCVGWKVAGKNVAGAICGVNEGSIDSCFVLGSIRGNDNVGGLCGINNKTIAHSYAMATVASTGSKSGGFCGANKATISNSYVMGELTGTTTAGGFCGSNAGTLKAVFAGNIITATGAGGLCGENSGTVTDCFFDKEKAGTDSNTGGGKALATADMKKKNSFTNWTFYASGGDWGIWENNVYPYFNSQAAPPIITKTTTTVIQGISMPTSAPDSIVLFKNHVRAGQCTPGATSWQITLPAPLQSTDEIYAVAYLTGKLPSRPAEVAQLPNNAQLKSLTIDAGNLIPAFDPMVLDYTIMPVANSLARATIAAAAKNPNAAVVGAGNKPLATGTNKFVIQVTSEDKTTTVDYTLTVVRKGTDYTPGSDATLKSLDAITGTGGSVIAFHPNSTSYTARVVNSTTQVMLTATPTSPYATVAGTGVKNLEPGANTFTITVTAENGTSQKEYTMEITRLPADYVPSDDAALQALTVSQSALSPAFAPDTYKYAASVAGSVSEITIRVTPAHVGAQIAGAGVKTLKIGENNFNIIVISESGKVTQTYTVTITRNLPSDVQLIGISVSDQAIDCSQGKSFGYVAECGVTSGEIRVYANEGTTVYIDGQPRNTFLAPIPETGYGRIKIVLISADQLLTKQYELVMTRSLPASIISKRWNNVLALIDNPGKNGGYSFTSCQWYKNGEELPGATQPYIRIDGSPAQYMVEAVTVDGYTLHTCPLSDGQSAAAETVAVYPNPVRTGETMYLQLPESMAEKGRTAIHVINMQGQVEEKLSVSGVNPSIAAPARPGMYLLQIMDGGKLSQTVKIVVN